MLKNLFRSLPPRNWIATRSFATPTPLRRPLDMERVDTTDRLAHLRQLMKSNKVDIYSKNRVELLSIMTD